MSASGPGSAAARVVPVQGLPGVSVVIPSHNGEARLAGLIPRLLEDQATREVVVVADGSTDGSVDLLRRAAAQDPRVQWIDQDKSGPAAARRAGLARATCPVALLLDDDVLPSPGLVSGHALRHAQSSGPSVVVGWMPTRVPAQRRPGDFATELYGQEYEQMCERYERDDDAILLDLWLGNVSVPRQLGLRAMEQAGDLLFHEDKEFGYRLRDVGATAVFDRGLHGQHLHSRDLEGFLRVSRREGYARQWLADHDTAPATLVRPADVTPAPLRPLLAAARSPQLGERLTRLGVGIVRGAGRLRLWTVESACARVLRQMQIEAGMREAREAAS